MRKLPRGRKAMEVGNKSNVSKAERDVCLWAAADADE